MITRDALKTEIDHIQEKDVEIVYKLIQIFTLSTEQFTENARRIAEQDDDIDERKARFFEFVNSHSFRLPVNYAFNREDLYERQHPA